MAQPPVPGRGEDNAADRYPPGPWTGMVLNELSGPGRKCADATDDELIGLLGRWGAQESWTVAAKLGVIRELLRRRALPGAQARRPGPAPRPGAQARRLPCGLPDAWDESVAHEVSAELGISPQVADKLTWLAWALEARIPRIGAVLEAGVIDYLKAKIIAEETAVLDDAHLAAAEELILAAGLAGKTPGQVGRIAARAVVTVDPDGARRRREEAEREDARVRFWRERAGTSTCSRHARESDFEHAIPYDKGGRTCACNAGARSRRCHKTKQSKGWNVTQPLPGWHQWTTPSGRTYTQGPMQYPA
jgi:hypothetical protein